MERIPDVAPSHTSLADLCENYSKSRNDVSAEIGEGCLVRYLLPSQINSFTTEEAGEFKTETDQGQWVTPTPYAPREAIKWLSLPAPDKPRDYAFVLDPYDLDHDRRVCGPRRVQLGGGVEYYLPDGFNHRALVEPWAIRVR